MLLATHIIQKEQEKARDQAYEDAAKQNEAYYRRMRAALDAGKPFDEPLPRFHRNRQ